MRRLISPKDMLRCEKAYFDTASVPSIDVMERAAMALLDAVLTHYPDAKRVYFACGPGGNGGDGYACARLAHTHGLEVRIFEVSEAKSADAIENRRQALALGIEINPENAEKPDVWVDCLYGTGLSRSPSGRAAELIEEINRSGARVVCADIPSGLDGQTGLAYNPCARADVTVSFQYGKYGHFLRDGLDMCGEIITADVGFPAEAFPEKLPELFEPADIVPLFRRRGRNIHKGQCGHLLIVAGSVGMAGAAVLCVKAALRSGAGLVSVACPEEIVPIMQISAPCAMCIPLPQRSGAVSAEAVSVLKDAFAGKSAVAIGPGLSRRAAPEIVEAVLESGLPSVIDADGLNIISENPELKNLLGRNHIITPHPGEAARLLGKKCEDPVSDGSALSLNGSTAVLKGASRVICDGERCFVSASGSGCMARGGSGDILTGILGAVLAEPSDRSPIESAAAACEIHGLCGALAEEKYGLRSANAADLIEFLPEVLKNYASGT